jgi:hypothetical protein
MNIVCPDCGKLTTLPVSVRSCMSEYEQAVRAHAFLESVPGDVPRENDEEMFDAGWASARRYWQDTNVGRWVMVKDALPKDDQWYVVTPADPQGDFEVINGKGIFNDGVYEQWFTVPIPDPKSFSCVKQEDSEK